MVNRPVISEELKDVVSAFVKTQTENARPSIKNAKQTIIDGQTVYYREIDNDVIVIRRE